MADRPILEYEPRSPRGLRRKTVVALLAASAGMAIVAGGVVYRLSQEKPAAAVAPPPPPPTKNVKGGLGRVPHVMPWVVAASRAEGEHVG